METPFHWNRKAARTIRGYELQLSHLTWTNFLLQIVFLKAAKDVYEAQIAVDDVLLTGCDLPQAESECQGERPVRCGNGVSCEVSLSSLIDTRPGLHQDPAAV